jgi:hypothetical protein
MYCAKYRVINLRESIYIGIALEHGPRERMDQRAS